MVVGSGTSSEMVYSSYVKQRILLFRRESFQKIAEDLAKEGHIVSKSGVTLFFKKYAKEGSIGRKPGSGLTGKKTAALLKLVDSHMEKDDDIRQVSFGPQYEAVAC